jgi:beta-galactosidase
VTNPAPAAVYQSGRDTTAVGPGTTFSYTIGGFTAGTNYLVRLHFCETYWTAAGSRTFNVSINGTQVLTNFDIFATAGGQNIANIQQFTEPANSSGQFVILFTSQVNNALISGIEIDSTSPCTAPTAPSGLTATATSSSQINLSWTASSSSCGVTYNVFRSTTSGFTPSSSNQIASGVTSTTYSDTGLAASTAYYYLVEGTNSGGASAASNQANATTSSAPAGPCTSICIDSGSTTAVSPFLADEDFTGGATTSHANTINTSKVTNPAPAAVYQTGRDTSAVGPGTTFTYTIGGFTANSSHTVRLHFCETYWTAAGQRTFNVSINGTQVLTNFDIFAAAGGQNIANIQQFTETANASGQYVILFTSEVNNALISGIEID